MRVNQSLGRDAGAWQRSCQEEVQRHLSQQDQTVVKVRGREVCRHQEKRKVHRGGKTSRQKLPKKEL